MVAAPVVDEVAMVAGVPAIDEIPLEAATRDETGADGGVGVEVAVAELEIEPDWEPATTGGGRGGVLRPHPVTDRPRLTSDLFERLEASFDDGGRPGGGRRRALDVASFVVPRD